jgi:SAM-dependent methyltransferase
MFKALLTHPLARQLDPDNPDAMAVFRKIVRNKRYLGKIYNEWYQIIVDSLPSVPGRVLELGSGPGFMSDYIPDLITSDFMQIPEISLVFDAHDMPFASGSLRAIVMTDVLHHLCSPRIFFNEASRCMECGGRIIMIEPWTTAWSSVIYSKLHHEPFDPKTHEWSFPSKGPLSGANGALPWIIFSRDFALFEQEFPQWQLKTLRPMMPFSYLLAGGLSLRSFAPGSGFSLIRRAENLLDPWIDKLAMFAHIVLELVEPLPGCKYPVHPDRFG